MTLSESLFVMLYFYNLFLKSISVSQMSLTAAWFPHASNKDLPLPHKRRGPDTVKFSVLNKFTELTSRLVTGL